MACGSKLLCFPALATSMGSNRAQTKETTPTNDEANEVGEGPNHGSLKAPRLQHLGRDLLIGGMSVVSKHGEHRMNHCAGSIAASRMTLITPIHRCADCCPFNRVGW